MNITKQEFSSGILKHQMQESFGTYFAFLAHVYYSIWGACLTRRGMFHETEESRETSVMSSTVVEARPTNPERQGHRSRRSARSEALYHRVDHPRRLKKLRGRRKPSFSSLFASQTTRAAARSRLRSEIRSLHPCRCCPRGASGLRQPLQDTPKALAS